MTTSLQIKLAFTHLACLFTGVVAVLVADNMTEQFHPQRPNKPTPHMIGTFLQTRLHLTQEQEAKIEPIIAQQDTKLQQLTPDQQIEQKKLIEEQKTWHPRHRHFDW
jgi:Spy/CpxP family protein refolding chaperone